MCTPDSYAPDPDRRGLRRCLLGVALLALAWNAAMLIGGLRAAGQLESQWNPLGAAIIVIAALAIVSATGVFYYVLACRARVARGLLILSVLIVAGLTLFASATQLVMVVDAASGEDVVKAAELRVRQARADAARIDAEMTATYRRQLTYFTRRMEEEARTGRGPRYRAAARVRNRLRAEYGGTLGQAFLSATPPTAATGSLNAAAENARADIASLRGKAVVFARFADSEDVTAQDYTSRLDELTARLAINTGGGWIDRKTLVYRQVTTKLGEMIASQGRADIGFSLSAFLSLTPDLIQILCASLLALLRPVPVAATTDTEAIAPAEVVRGWLARVRENVVRQSPFARGTGS